MNTSIIVVFSSALPVVCAFCFTTAMTLIEDSVENLKVNVYCDRCKMIMMDYYRSIPGVYSVSIDHVRGCIHGIVTVASQGEMSKLWAAIHEPGVHSEYCCGYSSVIDPNNNPRQNISSGYTTRPYTEHFANIVCTLKVKVDCHKSKMKIMKVYGSIQGVYSVSVDMEPGRQEGIATVTGVTRFEGEGDPRELVRAISRSVHNAELLNMSVTIQMGTKKDYTCRTVLRRNTIGTVISSLSAFTALCETG